MPKVKPNMHEHLRNLFTKFGNDIFSTDEKILLCKICSTKVAAEKRFTVQQHNLTSKHKRGLQRLNVKKQSILPSSAYTSDDFCKFPVDLCEALLSANIPLQKLNNLKFRNFFEQYIDKCIPDESTLRKTYVKVCYEKVLSGIRNSIGNKKLWVSIDETTDVDGRYIANVVIGTLESDRNGSTYLLTTEILDRVNHSTICGLFENSMLLLWPNGILRENIMLFLTDAAPYMVKAASGLQYFYPKMIHITCVAHGLHRVAEEIRQFYPKVELLISNVKKVFLKSPFRVQLFKDVAPQLSLPPRPIITRWGTWLNAVNYYCDNFETLSNVIKKLDGNESVCVRIAQECFNDINIASDLAYIKASFQLLAKTITQLEEKGQPLNTSIGHIVKIGDALKSSQGPIGECIFKKFLKVFNKNSGFTKISKINDILNGNSSTMASVYEEFSPTDIEFFKYAPITSVDVERSFSIFKNLLTDNRRSFTFENLRMTFVVHCNNLSLD